MSALIRLLQSLPLVIALCVLALVLYVVISWVKSPTRAKEILIKVFMVLTIALCVVFAFGTVYALIESNTNVAEFFGAFLAIAAIALAVTLVCRWRFRKNHPNYTYKPQQARTMFRWESALRKILELLKNNPYNPRG